jgi:hypothetical protein
VLPQPKPQVSLETVAQGSTEKVQEAAQVSVQETVKLVAERFERHLEDAHGSPFPLVAPILLFCK